MLKEPFALGHTFVHRLDPRLRIVIACAYSILIALSYNLPALLSALGISLAMVGAARLGPKDVAKKIIIVNAFVIFIWLVLPLTFQGPVSFTLGPLKVYGPGIILSAQITLKSNAILLMLMALVATMPLSTLGAALHRLRVPGKIVHLLLMTYRYIFVIEEEYQRLVRAALIRGFQADTSLHTYKTYAYIVGMLFVRSALRADRVYHAMRCRGFMGRFYCLHEFSVGKAEWVFGTAMGLVMTALISLSWQGLGVIR